MILNQSIQKVHCVGIGGIGVSALAEWLVLNGYQVQGSDTQLNDNCKRLIDKGVTLFTGHASAQVNGVDLVVYSSAINADNPELVQARRSGIACVKRGELLADIVNLSESIVVAGTHGKTTTTSLAIHLLTAQGLDPSAIVGGVIAGQEGPLRQGSGHYFIVESDESDGSFLHLRPKIVILTNIDKDHLNHYANDFEQLKTSFVAFLNTIPEHGVAIVNADDDTVTEILPRLTCRVLTVGFKGGADYWVSAYSQRGMASDFSLSLAGGESQRLVVNLPGMHNVNNAAAACAVVHYLAGDECELRCSLQNFPGVGRRFSYHGRAQLGVHSVRCVEDYGHHPRSIGLTIAAARRAWPLSRVVMVFQPHRYSRTRDLLMEFVEVLQTADLVVLLEVYSAGEDPSQGVGALELYRQFQQRAGIAIYFVPRQEQLKKQLQQISQDDDVLLFQGAGNIGMLARQWVGS